MNKRELEKIAKAIEADAGAALCLLRLLIAHPELLEDIAAAQPRRHKTRKLPLCHPHDASATLIPSTPAERMPPA